MGARCTPAPDHEAFTDRRRNHGSLADVLHSGVVVEPQADHPTGVSNLSRRLPSSHRGLADFDHALGCNEAFVAWIIKRSDIHAVRQRGRPGDFSTPPRCMNYAQPSGNRRFPTLTLNQTAIYPPSTL